MKNIFFFIRNFFVLICFFVLQIICIVLLSKSSKTHQAFFSASANEVTGIINKQYTGVKNYLFLKQENDRLRNQNAQLLNTLKADYEIIDTTVLTKVDSTIKDTIGRYRKYFYLPAKVVGNTITSQTNYIMLQRGKLQGIKEGMSVISALGVVGVVDKVSDNYSKVMSLLHKNTKITAMIKKNSNSGDIEWDGINPSFVTMKKVSKSAEVKKGDTIVTSTYSANFPSNINIGIVEEVKQDANNNYYNLKVKTATNFFTLQHAFVIQNVRFAEQTTLANSKDTRSNE